MSLNPWIITLFTTCFWVDVGSQISVDIPPLRASELIIPVSNRFQLIRSAPVTTRSISPFQVMQKLADVPDDGETFREGPLDINGRLTARLVWKSFEADINQRIEGEWMWVPLKVLSAYGQIVSGMQYDLKVLAGTSNCSRYQVNAYTIQEQNCVHFNGPKRAIFNILVMERSSKSWSPFIPDWERVFSTVDREIGDNEDI
ncbi:Cystatin domain-containing protein [Caenorhabditis elegans]|uniref:Cystatin domain-containing protein n=1 Tax=Caenorhabditis elegans TaxID=6239 RepID=C2BR91_CAEEL|nr:Cystatin domain-containing protein [Caenorhabditis elegans]CCD67059.1 Cystatin domain-containing protein [Caenorhabditis elegans]|eukprot:NP_497511.3 Cystatin [Caenorhabditis elegans]